MKCEDLLKRLSDYVDGDIDPSICEEFEDHFKNCDPCSVVVDNIKKTITLFKGEEIYEMPEGFRDKLHKTLKEQWLKNIEEQA